MRKGVIKVDGFGSKVPAAVQQDVLVRQRDIAAGKLHPFHAAVAVLNNEGKEVIAKGQTLTDEQIFQVNWLVQGVQSTLH